MYQNIILENEVVDRVLYYDDELSVDKFAPFI